MKIAINNLVQNMLKYAPIDSDVEIVLDRDTIIFKNSIIKSINRKNTDLFEPFQRGENALDENTEGSGLGLSLVKKILELHRFKYNLDTNEHYFIFKIIIF